MFSEERLVKGGKYYIYCSRTSMSGDCSAHLHNYYEFLHITEGNLYCIIENNEYLLSAGDMIVTTPEELHSLSFLKECVYKRDFLQIKPELIDAHFPHTLDFLKSKPLGQHNYIPANLFTLYGLNDIFRNIRRCAEHDGSDMDIMIETYAVQLISKVNEILSNEDIKNGARQKKSTKKIREYILNHLFEKIDLDTLSDYCYLDKSYLCRLFKKEIGMTINTYVNMQRTTFAKNMILSGMKITDIYNKCGFNDYSTFYRAFKKYAGMSPEEFKKQYVSYGVTNV